MSTARCPRRMSSTSILAAVVGLGCVALSSLDASATVYDPFDSYTAGAPLNGNNDGAGWAGPWTAAYIPDFNEWTVETSGLDGSANRIQHVRDAAGRLTDASLWPARSATRNISGSPVLSDGPVYIGFYFQHDAALGADANPNEFQVNLGISNGRRLTVGILGDELFIETFATSVNQQRVVSSLDAIGDGQIHQLVIRFEQDAGGGAVGGGTAELINIYLDPDSKTEPGSATFSSSLGASIAFGTGQTITSARFFGNYYNGDVASLDRFVISDNYFAAYIPEPASASLLILAAAPLLRRRRR